MISIRTSFLALAVLASPLATQAARQDTTAADYEQVRKIAQRDPKVRAAYEAADKKLAQKIVDIDPSLKGHTSGQPAPKVAKAAPKPAPKPAAKPMSAKAARKGKELSHVVAKGETLNSIASKYGVSVADLREANEITNDRKLIAGHVLLVPGGKKPATAAKPAPKPVAKTAAKPAAKPAAKSKRAASAPAKEEGFWEKLKNSF